MPLNLTWVPLLSTIQRLLVLRGKDWVSTREDKERRGRRYLDNILAYDEDLRGDWKVLGIGKELAYKRCDDISAVS